MALLLLLAVPIVLIGLAALVVIAIVLGVLAVTNAILLRVRAILPARDGRENVRVIRRDQ